MFDVTAYNLKRIQEIIDANNKLRGLTLSGNLLNYNGESVDVSTLNLNSIMPEYSKLQMDIKLDNIDAKTFFEVMQINSFKIEGTPQFNQPTSLSSYALSMLDNYTKGKDYDIISYPHFYQLFNKYPNLNESEQAEFNDFLSYINLLMIQDDPDESYLNSSQKQTLLMFNNLMAQLEVSGGDSPLIDIYHQMQNDCEVENRKRDGQKLLLEKKTGFVNALIVIPEIVLTGIVIGIIIYFFI